MIVSSKLFNSLNKEIHYRVRQEHDVSEWEFSPELHSLLAKRDNLVDQLLNQVVKSEVSKTLKEYIDSEVLKK